MSSVQAQAQAQAPAQLPRLLNSLTAHGPTSWQEHVRTHGPLPSAQELDAAAVVALVDEAGLRGRGGASFPSAVKMRSVVAARGRALVVANGCESEPLSTKDALLLSRLPHLVLDGALTAARAVAADEVIIAFEGANLSARRGLEDALNERTDADADADRVRFTLFSAANKFLSGQETALVSQINGGLAKPTFIPPRPTTRGVRRQPTLILNVETLAHLALIARYGSDWYRELGSEREPGSRLVTLAGAIHNPGIYEIENGTPLDALFEAAGGLNDSLGSVLVGGYFGSWFTPAALENVALSNAALAQTGAGLGCAAVVALPANACVVAETVRVAIYLATETAHQCGPCVHGTAAIARALHEIGGGTAAASAYADINRWTTTLPGRGACHHPNGLAHFVASAVHNFRDQFTDHAHKGPCDDCSNHILPIPHS